MENRGIYSNGQKVLLVNQIKFMKKFLIKILILTIQALAVILLFLPLLLPGLLIMLSQRLTCWSNGSHTIDAQNSKLCTICNKKLTPEELLISAQKLEAVKKLYEELAIIKTSLEKIGVKPII